MRAPRIPADEQFRLIMECRASGLTDHEWCLRNDINPRTFYNWVKRLRQKGCAGIPNAMRNPVPHKQEIVKIQLTVEYSNAIVHAFQRFRAPFSGKIVHIFPEQSAVI